MRILTSLLPLLLWSAACVTDDGADVAGEQLPTADGKGDSPVRRLVASTSAAELRLAAVEDVFGVVLRAITVWERDSQYNGRSLWVTMRQQSGGAPRVWRASDDIRDIRSLQFTSNGTKVVGTEHVYRFGNFDLVHFGLEVHIDAQRGEVGSTLDLIKTADTNEAAYSVESSNDDHARLLGQINSMARVQSGDHLVRLFVMGPSGSSQPNERKLFLVLTDRQAHHVFPVGLSVDNATTLRFDSARAIAFDTRHVEADGQETTTTYAVTWDEASAPTIRKR